MKKQLLLLLRFKFFLLVFGITAAVNGCRSQNAAFTFPGKEWEVCNGRETAQWDAAKLSALRKFIIDSANTTGMLVIYHGRILFQYGNVSDNSYLASCRKSIVAMLYGPFIESGQIKLNTTLADLKIDDIGGLLPIEKTATIDNILTARSGVFHAASNGGDAAEAAPPRGSVRPGSYFLYNNWDFNIAGYILEKQTGQNFYDIVDSILAKPLMMQDWNRNIQRKIGDSTLSVYKACHLWFSTRDMARIGYLMLRKGSWQQQRVLSPGWVNKMTTPVTQAEETIKNHSDFFHLSYGYLWWIWNSKEDGKYFKGAYTASGAFGQFITVLPALDVVVAHKTNYESYGRKTHPETYLNMLKALVDAKIF